MAPGLEGFDRGTTQRRTRLVWVAADHFEQPQGASLPLAFFPRPCIYRQAAVEALGVTLLEWHVILTSPNQQDLYAAVLARLATSILTRDDLEPSMKMVDGQYGLPPLPEAEFTLLSRIGCRSSATGAFARLALELPEATSMSAAF